MAQQSMLKIESVKPQKPLANILGRFISKLHLEMFKYY